MGITGGGINGGDSVSRGLRAATSHFCSALICANSSCSAVNNDYVIIICL